MNGRAARRWAIALLGGGLVLAPVAAAAAPTSEIVQGEFVRIVSTIDEERIANLRPGQAVRWDLDISADAPEPGTIQVSLRGAGTLPLSVDARACDSAWEGDACPGGARELVTGWMAQPDGGARDLVEAGSDETLHLRLDVIASAEMTQASATELRVLVRGFGDDLGVGPDGSVAEPPTGADLAGTGLTAAFPALLALAALLVGAGALAVAAGRRRAEDGS